MAEFNFPEWLMAPEPPTPEVPPEYAEADAVREQQLNDQYLAGQRQILNQGENAYYRQQGEAVRFALDPQDWHGHGGEFLWASPLSVSQGDEFEIRNYPCFTRGIG